MSHRSTCRANTAGIRGVMKAVFWPAVYIMKPDVFWLKGRRAGGDLCALTWHCWRNGMTSPLQSFTLSNWNLKASGKLPQPLTCRAITRESVTEMKNHVAQAAKNMSGWMTQTALVLNLVFFSQIFKPLLPSSFLSLYRSCLLERPPTENTIPLPMVLCCQDRERPLV